MKKQERNKKLFWLLLAFVCLYLLWQNYKKRNTPVIPAPSFGRSANLGFVSDTNVSTVTPAASVPAAVTGATTTATAGNTAISWGAASGATGYTVERSVSSGSGFVAIASGLTATNYNDTTGTVGVLYYYRVVATNATGNAAPSSNATATAIGAANNAYALNAISAAVSSTDTTRIKVTPSETNRPSGALNYVLIVKNASGAVVRDYQNPLSLNLGSYPSIDFTPNDSTIPVNQRITTAGDYTIELTCNGITKATNITLTNANLGITAPPPVAAGGYLNRSGFVTPPLTQPPTLWLNSVRASNFLDVTISPTTDPTEFKFEVVNNESWPSNRWLLNGVELTQNFFFAKLEDSFHLVRASIDAPQSQWWDWSKNHKLQLLRGVYTKS